MRAVVVEMETEPRDMIVNCQYADTSMARLRLESFHPLRGHESKECSMLHNYSNELGHTCGFKQEAQESYIHGKI